MDLENKEIKLIRKEKREEYYKDLVEESKTVLQMVDEDDSWELKKDIRGVKLFRAEFKDSDYKIYRSTMYLDGNRMENVRNYVDYENEPLINNEEEEMKKRDPLVIESRILEEYESDKNFSSSFLVFTRNTSGSFWVYDREFLYLTITKENEDGSVIQISRSVNDEDEILVKKHGGGVRGKMLAILLVRKEDSGRYRIDWILHVDPSGLIPSLLFNSTFGRSVFNLASRGKEFFESESVIGKD